MLLLLAACASRPNSAHRTSHPLTPQAVEAAELMDCDDLDIRASQDPSFADATSFEIFGCGRVEQVVCATTCGTTAVQCRTYRQDPTRWFEVDCSREGRQL